MSSIRLSARFLSRITGRDAQAGGGLRVGVPKEYFGAGWTRVRAVVEQGLRKAGDLGCELQEVSLPHTKYAIADYYIIAPGRGEFEPGTIDAARYGLGMPDRKIEQMYQ